jgi:hypothetical protein
VLPNAIAWLQQQSMWNQGCHRSKKYIGQIWPLAVSKKAKFSKIKKFKQKPKFPQKCVIITKFKVRITLIVLLRFFQNRP